MGDRILMVSRMDPDNADTVARLFAEHDRSDLPRRVGVSSRTLFHYQGLTMHLIQAEHDIRESVLALHREPAFREVNEQLAPYMSPIVSDWRGVGDSQAMEFYHRSWV
ncbi:TcmI family type II polyketide cyclase [Streptomonospora arabica]